MLKPGWSLLFLAALALVAALAMLRPWTGTDRLPEQDKEETAIRYEAYSSGIRTTRYNEDGQLAYILQAERQVNYTDNTTEVSEPVIRLFADAMLRWHITARSGRILGTETGLSGIELMELLDTVKVRHTGNSGQRVVMETEYLAVEPNEEFMRTDQPVHMRGQGFEHHAEGMQADMARDRIEFMGELRGRYHESEQ